MGNELDCTWERVMGMGPGVASSTHLLIYASTSFRSPRSLRSSRSIILSFSWFLPHVLGPKIAVPIRTWVAPSSIAVR
jgi:hypothetical protein